MNVSPTIVVLHEQSGVLELVEAALRDRGTRVLGTLDAFEAAEIVCRLKVDLLVTSPGHNHMTGDLRALQADLPVVVLADEPVSLDEIADAVLAAVSPRRECS
jgi:DNA-binding response OmpR family regulator